jgi:hypothetical protein
MGNKEQYTSRERKKEKEIIILIIMENIVQNI